VKKPIPIDENEVRNWQTEWHTDYRPLWVVGKDGKFRPKPAPSKGPRKNLDELDIATVR
jgi:hypothetical protein